MIASKGFLTISVVLLVIASSVPVVGFGMNQAPVNVWPNPDWSYSTPFEEQMDDAVLQEMLDYFVDNNININSIVVTRNGHIVLEEYYDFFDENTSMSIFSCTKTIMSTLIGIAIDKGFIANTSSLVLDFFPDREFENMNQMKEQLTIYDLLTMQAGIEWNDNSNAGNSNYNQMIRTDDWVQYVLDQPISITPGTVFTYNTGASHILSAILQNSTGMTSEEFANQYLMEPLDIEHFHWRESPQGITIGGNTAMLRPRDMAKVGYLYLMNGTWNDEEVVSADWIAEASRTHTIVGGGTGYGYQIWTRDSLGSFSARGYAGQYIFVVPEYSLVVVFTATTGWPNTSLEDWIIPSIVNFGMEEPMDWTIITIIAIVGGVIGVPIIIIGSMYIRRRPS
ncbi:MAG: serine hydrolase domain-containing protein [Candidatus Thorarchaeota archaeon]|jgi:CubicO group peptidase (beta-lactamase class C family)